MRPEEHLGGSSGSTKNVTQKAATREATNKGYIGQKATRISQLNTANTATKKTLLGRQRCTEGNKESNTASKATW
jgi:hypothetical protein